MCGITGYISNQQWDSQQMLEVLHHRGPDSVGEFKEEIEGQNLFLR